MRCTMRRRLLFFLLLPAAVMLGGAVPFPEDSPIAREVELLPVSPALNDQRGFAIAMDGEWLAVGARLEDVGGVEKAGAVHLFQFEAAIGTWRERASLISETAEQGGQFGFAVALRGNTLAVSAVGEKKVDVFTQAGGAWTRQQPSLTAPGGEPQFGISVSVDGTLIA